MTVSPISPSSFHLDDEGRYQLVIPGHNLKYDATQHDLVAFREELADLLPENLRFQDAMLNVRNARNLSRHPANWSLDEDIYFLVSFVAEDPRADLTEVEGLLLTNDWTSSSDIIKADVEGESEHWQDSGVKAPVYEGAIINNMAKYMRNKLIHFDQLDQSLKAHFGGSKRNLVAYFDEFVRGKEFIFSIWEAINGKVPSMRRFWVI